GEQHAVLADAGGVEDLEGRLPHGTAADDEDLHRLERERADPLGVALVERHGLLMLVAHHSNSRCGPVMGEGTYFRIIKSRFWASTRRLVPGITMRDTEPRASASFGFMSSRS